MVVACPRSDPRGAVPSIAWELSRSAIVVIWAGLLSPMELRALCFTPTYASWANPMEAHFGPLRQLALAHSNHPNHPDHTRALHAYLYWRGKHTRRPHLLTSWRPDVLAAQ